ncbi:regulator of chromosome condensation 1/beta-lactamase-inhibitor protein II [Suillus occidentalis]|nr:regulator of chromosome condensation 1/beta-lactamase-inhibitor protein II [Suillus occidentalis]
MSKLHSVVLTFEARDNIRVCSFGSGGRLGPSQHTQYSLMPLPEIKHTIESVALGQDHTLALTSTREVLTWGLNRFSQLGYVIGVSPSAKQDEYIQATPWKVTSLRRKFVKGVAACKTASGRWTDTEVWTWGTNGGQLGYDKALAPVQALSHKVSSIVKSVRAIVMTNESDSGFRKPSWCVYFSQAKSCVLDLEGFPRLVSPPRDFPQRSLFTDPRKQSRDVDIGTDGSVIVCTQSGS